MINKVIIFAPSKLLITSAATRWDFFKDFQEFPEHRSEFFLLIQAVNDHCFEGLSVLAPFAIVRVTTRLFVRFSFPPNSSRSIQVGVGLDHLGIQTLDAKCGRDR